MNEVLELIDSGDVEDDSHVADGYYRAALQKLQEQLLVTPGDAELQYLSGLAWYSMRGDSEERKSQVERCFTTVLLLKPTHQFARLYLGHYYFDEGRYEKAMDSFLTIDGSYFESIGQMWRMLKLEELILCCKIYLEPSSVSERNVSELSNRYFAARTVDRPRMKELEVAYNRLSGKMSGKVVVLISELLNKGE